MTGDNKLSKAELRNFTGSENWYELYAEVGDGLRG